MDTTGTLPEAGRLVDVWTYGSTYTQSRGVSFDKEPSWVACYVRESDVACDRMICVEQASKISFALNRTHRWRYRDA